MHQICGDGRQRSRVRGARELDPIVGRDDPTGEWRAAEPDIEGVDQAPAIGEVAGERISHPPNRPRFGQHDIDQIAFRGHPDGEWRSEAQPRSAAPGTSLDERQPGGSQRRGPSRGHLALCHVGRGQVAGDDQTPALAGLGGRIRKLRHVC